MSRYTGPRWKIARRLNYSISETGKELEKRPYPPGQHGKRRSKLSDYATQLQEKQKLRFTYGVSEKQFKKTFIESAKIGGVHGEDFIKLLESRLDNVVYRIGFASSRAQARQLVNHGHVLVDGNKVDIPSYRLQPGQKITLREKAQDFKIVNEALESMHARKEFIGYDEETKTGTFARYPERDEVAPEIQEHLIVEFYSR